MQSRERIVLADVEKRIEAIAHHRGEAFGHSLCQERAGFSPSRPDGAAQQRVSRHENALVAKPGARPRQQRRGAVEPQRLAFEEPRQPVAGVSVEDAQTQVLADALLMFGDRLLATGAGVDCLRVGSQLQGGESQDLLVDLQWRLLGKSSEHAHEGDLVGEPEPIVSTPSFGDLLPVGLEEAGVADQPRAGDVGGGHDSVRGITSASGRQFDDAERHSFLVPYLSNKIQEFIFPRQPVKTVAYLLVSTAQQDVRSQRLAILECARNQDFPIDDFIEATASGQASEKRRRLDELLSVLQRGDRLVVSELSRLGRSLGQIVAILDALAKAGVAFVAIKENIRVEGKHDIQTKVMTTLFALFAEVERDLISERTRGASPGPGPRARSWGVQKGRSACHASTARRTTSATSSTSASRKARSPRSPASPDRLSITSLAREASSRIASVYFYTNLVSTLAPATWAAAG